MRRPLLFLLVLVGACIGLAAVEAWAGEAICPTAFGGSGTRADVVWCSDFEVAANCTSTGGVGNQCWLDNHFNVGANQTTPDKWTILNNQADAAVGNSYTSLTVTQPGSVGVGVGVTREPTPGAPHLKIARRWYHRFTEGYLAFESAHGPGHFMARHSGGVWDFSKSAEFKFQNSTFSGQIHPIDGIGGCEGGLNSTTLNPNQGTWVPMQHNKWYRLEYQVELDTACSDQGTSPWSGCNGTVRFWQDGVLTHKHTGLNLGGAQCEMRFYSSKPTQQYFHRQYPPWDATMSIDNIVESNLAGLTPGDTPPIGAATGEYPNGRGAGDALSPYYVSTPYATWIGRRAAGDCAAQGDFGDYNTEDNFNQFRGSVSMVTLDPTVDHGTYVDQGTCVTAFAQLAEPVATGGITRVVGTIRRISDGSGAAVGQDCAGGGGASQWCRWDGALWKVVASPAQALKVSLTSSGTGGGAQTGGPPGMVFPQYAHYGWIRIPSQAANTAFSHLALVGWVHDITQNPTLNNGGHVSLTMAASGGGVCTSLADCKWAVGQHTTNAVAGKLVTGTQVTFDTWHEYELIVWRNGSSGCASANGCVSLMIDRNPLLEKQPLPQSAAWMFSLASVQFYPIIGVIDFQGSPTFTAYYDDNTVASASAWSCDGWGAASCPFPAGDTFNVSVAVSGDGNVTGTSGINCPDGGVCSNSYSDGTTVTLTPTPDSGASFLGWSGSCPVPGRLAVSHDGNMHDLDDLIAGAMMVAVLWKGGYAPHIVWFGHSDHTWWTDADREERMRVTTVETATRFGGFDLTRFYNLVTQGVTAKNALVAEINASSATNPLTILLAGQMELVGNAIADADPTKLQFVTIVSHSIDNNLHAFNVKQGQNEPGWETLSGRTFDQIVALGVTGIQIADGNPGLGLQFPGSYFWLRDSTDINFRWLWCRYQSDPCPEFPGFPAGVGGTAFDISDVTVGYWLVTGGVNGGDQAGTPAKIEALMTGPPAQCSVTDDAGTVATFSSVGGEPAPSLAVSPSSFSFTGVVGGANPNNDLLSISNIGTGLMPWSVSDNATWLTLTPSSGADAPGLVTVSVNTVGLGAGTHNAVITVTASASGSPQTIPVTLILTAATPSSISSGRVR